MSEEVCGQHSGCITEIENLKSNAEKHEKIISRIDAKLNMIIGAMALAPFIWTLLSGVLKVAQASGG